METDAIRVARGSAYLVVQSIVSMTISAVGFAVIARILTPTEMGVTVALTLTLGIALVLADLGFGGGLTKYVAEYRGRNVDYTCICFAGILMKVVIASSIAIFCAITAPAISEQLLKSVEYTFLFQIFSIDLLFACTNTTMNSLLLGMDRIKQIAGISVMSVFVRATVAVFLLLQGFGLVGYVTGWIIGDLVHLILSISFIVKAKSIRICPIEETIPYVKTLAKFSWPLFVTNTVAFLYNWFDRALLLVYIPLSEVAVYNVAYKAFMLLYTIPTALRSTLFPYYGEQYGRNKHENIIAGVRASTRYAALFYTPLALGLMITANPVITLFAGAAYGGGDVILAILSFLGGISGLGVALGTLLLVFEMTPTVLLVNACSIGASLALSAVLLPFLGTIGVAIVKGVSLIIPLGLTVIYLRRRLSIKFDKEAIWKSWTAAIIMLLAVGLIERVCFRRYLLLFYILVGGVVYVLALRILKAVNENDIQLIRTLAGPRAALIVNVIEKIFT